MSREFYIGYQKRAPEGLAVFVRVVCVLLGVIVLLVGALSGYVQAPVDRGTYEFGEVKEFQGYLMGAPLPHVSLTGPTGDIAAGTSLVLVSKGKYGMPKFAADAIGREVRFSGTLIYRDTTAMIEMAGEDTFEVVGFAPAFDRDIVTFGQMTLEGELVDTKCYLGVMRPGAGKIHRACASNCLRGGIQPGLLVRTVNGYDTAVLLAEPGGGVFEVNYQWAARTLNARGVLRKVDGSLVMEVGSIALVP